MAGVAVMVGSASARVQPVSVDQVAQGLIQRRMLPASVRRPGGRMWVHGDLEVAQQMYFREASQAPSRRSPGSAVRRPTPARRA